MATIKDIAQKVGVSSATVSRVLNHDMKISVSSDTRRAIFDAAKELGYKKKQINPKIDRVAFLYWVEKGEDLDNIYYKSIQKELEKQAVYNNVIFTQYFKKDGILAVDKNTKAFIALGWFDNNEISYLKKITEQGVFIDSKPDESVFDSVQPNFDSMVTQIVDYYIEKQHTNIGFIGATDYDMETKKNVMDEREWSYRQTAMYYNVLREENIFIANSFSVQEGYRMAIKAMDKLKNNMPTAFCVARDVLAIGVLQAFNERKWEIPDRVSFFSINDIGIAQYVSPPLTTFHVDIPLLCESAVGLLKERVLDNRQISKTVYINGKPIFRKSC